MAPSAGLLLLIPALLLHEGGAPPAAPPTEVVFAGRRVPLATPPRSQLADRNPVHVVGKAARIGGALFPAKVEGGLLRLAERPGGEPTTEVVPGTSLRLAWKGKDGGEREVSLQFDRSEGGGFTWWASEAVAFTVGGEDLTLYDIDGDGRYDNLEWDGWSTGGSGQVLPLAGVFPLGPNLVTVKSVAPDGSRLVARVEPLAGEAQQVAALVAVNRHRTAHGLPPVVLDGPLSAGCTEHAGYLKANAWNGTDDPHVQSPGRPGATPAGAEAAPRSLIFTETPVVSVGWFMATCYHRIALSCPWLDRIGISRDPVGPTVMDVGRAFAGMDGAVDLLEVLPWAEPVFVPADGSRGVRTRARPELPVEPVPNLGSRGLPLLAVFRTITRPEAFAGTLVAVKEGETVIVPVLPAAPGTFPFARGIVPVRPLAADTEHRATFTWKVEGRTEVRTIRFRTE